MKNNIFGKQKVRNVILERIDTGRDIREIFKSFACDEGSILLYNGTHNPPKFSYFGYNPYLVISSKNNDVTIDKGSKRIHIKASVFNVLKKIINTFKIRNMPKELEFVAGGMGYLAYDLSQQLEKLPDTMVDDYGLADSYFAFYRVIFIYDRIKDESWVAAVDFLEEDGRRASANAKKALAEFKKRLAIPVKHKKNTSSKKSVYGKIESNFTRKEYIKAIGRVKSYIYAGDIYQANLSQRFSLGFRGDPYVLFMKLSEISPAPFSCFINQGDNFIVSSSPERFMKVSNGIVETRPMKGTRPRSKNRKEDTLLARDLLSSEKDTAELSMIVDLLRNDIGKTCSFGSVKVNNHKNLEIYSTVFQMTSDISGELRKEYDCMDVLESCFPGGSITGCPKIRAMEIIDELEPTRRSVYTGSIGYIGFNGNMDCNIAIRTIILRKGRAYFQVGSGIVADSIPESEYRETLDKARGMVLALKKS